MCCDVWVGHLPSNPTLTLTHSLIHSHSVTLVHSHTFTITCTCCYGGIKRAQDLDFSCLFSDSLLLPHSCCPTLFHPHSSLFVCLSVCLTVPATVLIVLTIAALLSTVLSTVLSIVLSVLTNVLTVLYRCKPSVPMSKQVPTAVWRMKSLSLQPFNQFLLYPSGCLSTPSSLQRNQPALKFSIFTPFSI